MKKGITPGPWSFGEYWDGNVEPHVEMIVITAPKSKNYVQSVCSFPAKGRGRANAHLIAAAPDLLAALESMNHMGGDERGGYCICPLKDGSAPDHKHATSCADARIAIRNAKGEA